MTSKSFTLKCELTTRLKNNRYYIAPVGLILCALRWKEGPFFLVLYGCTAYYFMNKMSRLIVIGGPIASSLGGVALGYLVDWIFAQFSTSFNRNIWETRYHVNENEEQQQSSLLRLLRDFSDEADAHFLRVQNEDTKTKTKSKKRNIKNGTSNVFDFIQNKVEKYVYGLFLSLSLSLSRSQLTSFFHSYQM